MNTNATTEKIVDLLQAASATPSAFDVLTPLPCYSTQSQTDSVETYDENKLEMPGSSGGAIAKKQQPRILKSRPIVRRRRPKKGPALAFKRGMPPAIKLEAGAAKREMRKIVRKQLKKPPEETEGESLESKGAHVHPTAATMIATSKSELLNQHTGPNTGYQLPTSGLLEQSGPIASLLRQKKFQVVAPITDSALTIQEAGDSKEVSVPSRKVKKQSKKHPGLGYGDERVMPCNYEPHPHSVVLGCPSSKPLDALCRFCLEQYKGAYESTRKQIIVDIYRLLQHGCPSQDNCFLRKDPKGRYWKVEMNVALQTIELAMLRQMMASSSSPMPTLHTLEEFIIAPTV
jgi:hypothetical protein